MNDKWALWRYGERGWKWVGKNIDGTHGQTYRTNSEGDGLWRLRIDYSGQESWQQEKGAAQYQLPADRAKTIRRLARSLATMADLSMLEGNF